MILLNRQILASSSAPFGHMLSLVLCLVLFACGGKSGEGSGEGKAPGEMGKSPLPAFPAVDATGVIAGKAIFVGERGKAKGLNIEGDKFCEECWETPPIKEATRVNDDGSLPNVFVWVEGLEKRWTFDVPKAAVEVDQKGCLYVPHVVGVMAGQKLRVKNSDDTEHNVHYVGKVNRQFNFKQNKGDVEIVDKIKRAELGFLKCDIHPWMRQWVHVKLHPVFAVVAADGSFSLPALPAGKYALHAWHELHGDLTLEVDLEAAGKKDLVLEFGKKK